MKKIVICLMYFLLSSYFLQAQNAGELMQAGIDMGKTNYDSAVVLLQQGLSAAEGSGEDSIIANGHFYLARYQLRTNDFADALRNYQISRKMYVDRREEENEFKCIHGMGIAYMMLKMHDDALAHFFQALEYFENSPDSSHQINAAGLYPNIGNIYSSMSEDSLAMVFYKKGVTKCQEVEVPYLIAVSATLAGVSMLHYDKDSAMIYLEEARKVSTEIGDLKNLATIEIHLGDYYHESGEYEQAIPYYEKGYDIAAEAGIKIVMAEALNKRGLSYFELKQDQLAKDYFKQGLVISEEEELTQLIKSGYGYLHQIYARNGQSLLAYESLLKYQRYNDTLIERTQLREIGRIEGEYQVSLSKEKIRTQDQVIENLKIKGEKQAVTLRLGFLAGFLFLAFMVGLILFFRAQRKKDEQILEKEKALSEQLVQNLNYRKKQSVDLLAMITFKNEVIQKAEAGLKKVSSQSNVENIKKRVKSLTTDLKQLSSNSIETERLLSLNGTPEREFHFRLREKYGLTQRELSVCSLIRVELSTKEMAITLGSTDKAVEMAKYRLKKKLGLGPEDDLNSFVANF